VLLGVPPQAASTSIALTLRAKARSNHVWDLTMFLLQRVPGTIPE
jgi:hypothetical protein